MIGLSSSEVGCLLVGMVIGAVLVLVLTGLAWWFVDVRRAVREGTQLVGEELERNRKAGRL